MAGLLKDISSLCNWTFESLGLDFSKQIQEVEKIIVKEVGMQVPARGFVRLAGFSGATAISLAAYGAHAFKDSEASEKLQVAFESGNKLHLVHSVALMAVPLTKHPKIVGTLMTGGMFIFCGSCYYHALTGNTKYRWVTPYGGMMLIFAWITMMF